MKRYATRSGAEGSFRVYYPEQADLYLDDATPLYLRWIVRSADGAFYVVPAEECGWLRRLHYGGPRDQLKPVSSSREARAILQVVLGNTSDASVLLAQGATHQVQSA